MVSILLATYNGGQYLREQIDSILRQTCSDWVLLIADDGSCDDTVDIIRDYSSRYPEKISLVYTDPSGGVQNNFFRLLLSCPRDYIMLCDQDDVWKEDKIEKTLCRMKKAEAEYPEGTPLLVHSDLVVVDSNLGIISPSMSRYQKISPLRCSFQNLLVQNVVTGCTVMINKALVQLVDRKPQFCVMHDWWLALTAAALGEILYIDEPLILYRQHESNSVGAKNANSASFFINKLKNRETVRKNYREMFASARCFLDMYGDKLKRKDLQSLNAFLSIPQKNRAGKIKVIFQNKLFKNTFLRNLGQMFSI